LIINKAERKEFIMDIKSDRNSERAKFKFEFCWLMFGFEPEVTAAYDGMDWEGSLGRLILSEFFSKEPDSHKCYKN
jgi:hypothetical protein